MHDANTSNAFNIATHTHPHTPDLPNVTRSNENTFNFMQSKARSSIANIVFDKQERPCMSNSQGKPVQFAIWRKARKPKPSVDGGSGAQTGGKKKGKKKKRKKKTGEADKDGDPDGLPLLSRLHAYCSTTMSQITAAKRMCKVIAIDGTALTNNKGLTLVALTTFGADEVSFPMMSCLAQSENDVAMQFLCGKALPFFFCKILDSVTLALSDDGPALVKGLAGAIAKQTIGLGHAVQLLCFWHAIYKRRDEACAGNGKVVESVGTGVATMLSLASKRARTLADVEAAFTGAKAYLNDSVTAGDLTAIQAGKISSHVIDYASKNMRSLFPAATGSTYNPCCSHNVQTYSSNAPTLFLVFILP